MPRWCLLHAMRLCGRRHMLRAGIIRQALHQVLAWFRIRPKMCSTIQIQLVDGCKTLLCTVLCVLMRCQFADAMSWSW